MTTHMQHNLETLRNAIDPYLEPQFIIAELRKFKRLSPLEEMALASLCPMGVQLVKQEVDNFMARDPVEIREKVLRVIIFLAKVFDLELYYREERGELIGNEEAACCTCKGQEETSSHAETQKEEEIGEEK